MTVKGGTPPGFEEISGHIKSRPTERARAWPKPFNFFFAGMVLLRLKGPRRRRGHDDLRSLDYN